ncbi:MAG: FGGY family carbohydrate kinase, partial [Candidatus Caldarchaeum sp.]|nr:FGGY family carbohydrate kinase [Candidatus Caldarchaeum sp.]
MHLEVGTSSVKAVAIDPEGNELAYARKPIILHSPERNRYTQDAAEIRETVHNVLKTLASQPRDWLMKAVGVYSNLEKAMSVVRVGRIYRSSD